MRHWSFLCLALACAASAQFKAPPSKSDEAKKYHEPKVVGSPASVRMQAYEQRLRMEAASPFSQLLWRSIGPEIQGGRVIHIEAPANNPRSMHVAFATGGLWRTEDYGQTWTSLFDGQSAYAIGHFTVSPDGQTLWVGTGENNSQRTSYAGTGVFKSSDAGKTWQHMGLEATHRIGRIVVNPKDPNTVYVAALGSLYSQNTDRGVYKTTDGGKSWKQVLKIDEFTGAIDIVMNAKSPDTLIAATWDRDRRAWNMREGGPGTGLYRTTDGGKNWAKVGGGFPASGNLGRIGLAAAASKPETVYAVIDDQGGDPDTQYRNEYQPSGVLTPYRFLDLTDETFVQVPTAVMERFVGAYMPRGTKAADVIQAFKDKKMTVMDVRKKMEERTPNVWEMQQMETVVYRSDDFGKTWKRTHYGPLGDHMSYYSMRIFVDPKDANHVLFTGTLMLESFDGGLRWKSTCPGVHVDFHAFWIDPTNTNTQFAGSDGGFYMSGDAGKTWRHLNNLSVGQFTTIAVDTKIPYNIYGGLQDNGTQKGPSTYRSGRSPLWQWTAVGGGDGSAVSLDPRDGGDVLYTASQFGAFGAQNQKTGERWNARPFGQGLRFNWVAPFVISPHHPDIIYCGSQYLHRSLNQGRRFTTISGDLTKNLPNGDVPFSTLTQISESPFQFGLIYVGADDGSVKVTKNHGDTWEDISTPAKDRWVIRLIASRYDKATVYVAQNGYRQDEWSPYLWKSTDYGKTWTSIVGDLPAESINVVREDPKNSGWLYVGTDLGVFVSFNGGTNWVPLSGGIPRTPVHDIAIQEQAEEMVIGTHARSVWVFKLADLYRLTPEIQGKEFHIWPLTDMVRTNWEYRRRPEWDSTDGTAPLMEGELWTKSAGKGSLRLVDKDGKAVIDKAMDWAMGYNRFSLSMMLEPGKRNTVNAKSKPKTTVEDILRDPYLEERAKYVQPGTYTLEFVFPGRTEKVTWKVSD